MTDEWNITDRVITIVSGGQDVSVSAAAHNLSWEHQTCFGNSLNTVILAALKSVAEIERVQKKTSDAVAYFEMCTKASETLAAVQVLGELYS